MADMFRKNNEFGTKYQRVLHHLVEYEKYEEAPKDRKFSEYDVKYYDAVGNSMMIEVKADTYNIATGNIFIEYESNGVPSGISVTTADYWVVFCHNPMGDVINWYYIPTDYIRDLIRNQNYLFSCRAGYKKLSKGYLFREDWFRKYQELLDKRSIPEPDRLVMYEYFKVQY